MEKAIWNNKEYYAVNIARDYFLEREARLASSKDFLCPDANCKNRLLRYCHGEKRTFFAHLNKEDCDYSRFDKTITPLIREIKKILFVHFTGLGYDVKMDENIEGKCYIHLLITKDGRQFAIEFGTKNTGHKRISLVEEVCRNAGVVLKWIVVNDNLLHYSEQDMSWLKRHNIWTSENNTLLIIKEQGNEISQLRLDLKRYDYKGIALSFGYEEIYQESNKIQELRLENGVLGIIGFDERYQQWLLSKENAYKEKILDLERRNRPRQFEPKKIETPVFTRKPIIVEETELEVPSEIEKWFYKQEIVEKPKEYAVSADLKKRLRGSFPVYEDGSQWLLCKVCMKAKPIFEFTEKGRYGNLGFCKYCSKK